MPYWNIPRDWNVITYYGSGGRDVPAGSNGGNYGGGGGGGQTGCMAVNPELEGVTRQIMADMGGQQLSSHEWEFMFPTTQGSSTVSSEMVARMEAAHNLARAGWRKP